MCSRLAISDIITFEGHLSSEKHKRATEHRQQVKRMLSKGTVFQQIVKAHEVKANESAIQNKIVLVKLFKAVYFLAKKNWAVKRNFPDLITFLQDIGDLDIIRHVAKAPKNATYLSHYMVEEYTKIISDYLEENTIRNLDTSVDFTLLADESTDEADRSQLAVFVRYIDTSDNLAKEEYLGITKLGKSKTASAIF